MKKLLIMLLAVLMLFSFVSCEEEPEETFDDTTVRAAAIMMAAMMSEENIVAGEFVTTNMMLATFIENDYFTYNPSSKTYSGKAGVSVQYDATTISVVVPEIKNYDFGVYLDDIPASTVTLYKEDDTFSENHYGVSVPGAIIDANYTELGPGSVTTIQLSGFSKVVTLPGTPFSISLFGTVTDTQLTDSIDQIVIDVSETDNGKDRFTFTLNCDDAGNVGVESAKFNDLNFEDALQHYIDSVLAGK